MRTSEAGIALIKTNEGFSARWYNDNGKQAIGYGHDAQPGDVYAEGITLLDADTLLRHDLATRFEPPLNRLVSPDCTQNQFDALVDFAYNLGIGNLRTMLAHGWDQVPTQILRWCKVQDPVTGEYVDSPGLKARRAAEAALFVQP